GASRSDQEQSPAGLEVWHLFFVNVLPAPVPSHAMSSAWLRYRTFARISLPLGLLPWFDSTAMPPLNAVSPPGVFAQIVLCTMWLSCAPATPMPRPESGGPSSEPGHARSFW